MSHFDLLKEIWLAVYDPLEDTASAIEKYFHSDYEQCINGVNLKLQDYITHVLAQKQAMVLDSIEYKHVLEKENELFALYYCKGKNKDLQPIEAEVVAYFQFKNAQILRIHGQVRLISGNLSDADMHESQ